jgi:hypothetical protein
MTRTPDLERLMDAYFEEGVTELPDRVYEVVRSDIDRTRQRAIIGPWRKPDMQSLAKLAMAAAAVVVFAIVGYNLVPGRGAVGGAPASPSGSPPAAPSASAPALPAATDAVRVGPLAPGTYSPYLGSNVRVVFTVPAGWRWDSFYLTTIGDHPGDPPDGIAIGFWTGRVSVYGNPCSWLGTEPDPPTGPTARDLVEALAVQPMRNATKPTVRNGAGPSGSVPGWSVDLTVPTDIDFSTCSSGEFRSWGPESNRRYHQGPGQRDTVWALDLPPDLRFVVDVASFPQTPTERMTEVGAILDSLVIVPSG